MNQKWTHDLLLCSEAHDAQFIALQTPSLIANGGLMCLTHFLQDVFQKKKLLAQHTVFFGV